MMEGSWGVCRYIVYVYTRVPLCEDCKRAPCFTLSAAKMGSLPNSALSLALPKRPMGQVLGQCVASCRLASKIWGKKTPPMIRAKGSRQTLSPSAEIFISPSQKFSRRSSYTKP